MTLEILTTPVFGSVVHGFFTRRGGASSGIYAGLNCGPGSRDQAHAVALNRARAAAVLGVEPARLLALHQYHSDTVVVAEGSGWTERPRADAAVSRDPGLAISVLTADCAPVLFADAEAGVVGAAHAGWRGALSGVIEATVAAMVRLGADRGRIAAVVGPTISQRAYEVGPEFLDAFLVEDRAFGRYFAGGPDERPRFDLPGFVLYRLREAGVGSAEWIGACTYTDPVHFFSYRRATHAGEPDYGRLLSAIRAPG